MLKNTSRRRILSALTSIFLLIAVSASAQRPFGNEWIEFGQPYFKLKVAKNGVYRVNFNDLVTAGWDASQMVYNTEVQLYYRGKQVPIFVYSPNDSVFTNGAYVEFYGQRNDGKLDTVLYGNPKDMSHTYFSSFTDTSAYFLTWSFITPSERIRDYKITGSTYKHVNEIVAEKVRYFTETYYDGAQVAPKDNFGTPEYTNSEGWQSNPLGKGQTREYGINTGNADKTSSTLPTVEFRIHGRSDYWDPSGADVTPDHNLVVSIKPQGGTARVLLDTTYNGFKSIVKKFTLQWSDIGTKTMLVVTSKGTTAPADLHTVAYFKIDFPVDLKTTEQLNDTFFYRNNSADTLTHFSIYSGGISGADKYVLYDVTNGYRSAAYTSGDSAHFIIANNGSKSLYHLYDSTQYTLLTPEKVKMKDYDLFENYNYLIITNKALWSSATEFYNYKKGKKIDTVVINPLMVDVEDLYNSFYYGVKYHPAAIQNFIHFAYKKSEKKPQYLLFIGKGYEDWAVRSNSSKIMVPSIGVPSAELMFTSGIDNGYTGIDFTLDPYMAIGRIPAKNNEDVLAYLNKLKEYDTVPAAFWHKNIIHVGGGTEFNVQQEAKFILNKIKAIAEGPQLGAKVTSFFAESSDPVNKDKKAAIQKRIETGASMLTYFGHASGAVLGVEIADFKTLNNKGKYPIMYLNGCNVGNSALTVVTMGEQYLLTPDKGAISWIGHTNITYTGALDQQMTAYYNQMTKETYGGTIGDAWRKVLAKTSFTPEPESRAYEFSWNIQGDPSIKFPYLPLPDYSIADTSIKVFPENATASAESFDLAIPVVNIGRTDSLQISIKVKHYLPDGSTHIYPVQKMLPPYYADTVYFNIPKQNRNLQGLNKFDIWVDADSVVIEMNEANNFAHFERFIPGTGVRLLFPLQYAIVPNQNPELVAQSRDLFDTATQMLFELDTVPYFNSPNLQKSAVLTGKNIVSWSPQLQAADSTVYYWRARLNLPVDSGGFWESRSFTYIQSSKNGWSQSHFPQYTGITSNDIYIDTVSRKFEFNIVNKYFVINANAFPTPNTGIKPEDDKGMTPCIFSPTTLAFIEFDRTTVKPVDTFFNSRCALEVNYQIFNMRDATERAKFVTAINNIKNGNYVALISRESTQGFSGWEPNTIEAFHKIGSQMLDTVTQEYTAFVIAGIKGETQGILLDEDIKQFKTKQPGDTAQIRVAFQGIANSSGTLVSETIGRASKWQTVYTHFANFEDSSSDQQSLNIIGIRKTGADSILAENITDSIYDISWINASDYPLLRLELNLVDEIKRTPAQLKMWTVLYEGVPEGTLLVDKNYRYESERLQKGDSLRVNIMYKNISTYPMQPVVVNYTVSDATGATKINDTDTMQALQPGQSFYINKSIDASSLTGSYNFALHVNPDYQQPEVTLDNNILRTSFRVVSDESNPVLDVTFDKRHIRNGEIVSANTHIEISAADENQVQILTDTSMFMLYLRKPGDDTLQRIYFNNSQIQFTPATTGNNKAHISFKPGPLNDGTYELAVQVKDAAGNSAAYKPFNIAFKVVNKTSISNFYVYPNPVSTSGARFVFTVTGSYLPDIQGIAIYNLNGKLVSGISGSRLKNLVVGTNEIWWNATDVNGDPLTNGLYFYRVITNPDNLEHFSLPEDRQMDKGYGKLLILRDRP